MSHDPTLAPHRPASSRLTAAPEVVAAERALSTEPRDPQTLSRRRLLQGLLGVGGLAVMGLPAFTRGAHAGLPLAAGDRILVVLALTGGNDILNTIVPADDGRYYDKRRSLAIAPQGLHPLGEGLYLHPNLGRLKARYDAGRVAVVRGVGEPTKDHSHFSGMARWMGGHHGGPPFDSGWLGRYLDGLGTDSLGGVAVGQLSIPLLLRRRNGETIGLPTKGSLFGAEWSTASGSDTKHAAVYRALSSLGGDDLGRGPWLDEIARVQGDAIANARTVAAAYQNQLAVAGTLASDMELAAKVINLDVGPRVVYASLNEFDNHANQRPKHDELLAEVDLAIDTFFNTLRGDLRNRVSMLVYSEFSRRVAPNGSGGTDHGAGGSVMMIGDTVSGGLYGDQPSLADLDFRGDLKPSIDFRSVYQTILDGYLGADAREILGGTYQDIGFFDPANAAPPPVDPTPDPSPDPTTDPTPVPPPPVDGATCAGHEATIVGTHGDDVIVGTHERDVIVGGHGDDNIRGLGGDDVICGGPGDDTIRGNRGHDFIGGGDGRDKLSGGYGHDTLDGGKRGDILRGDEGRDRLFGGRGLDKLISDAVDLIVRQ